MKTRTKALLLSLCAVLLVTVSVLGTVAYLTSTQTVTNTFTVGKVKITLDEANVDEDYYLNGELSTKDEEGAEMPPRDQANDYHLLPGGTYEKDPTVHVAADSEDCYVFVKVVNNIKDIEEDATGTANTIASQLTANGWEQLSGVDNVYTYTGEQANTDNIIEKSAAVVDLVVFEFVVIGAEVNNDTLSTYENKSVEVTAYAVQAEGFESALDAWNATYGK